MESTRESNDYKPVVTALAKDGHLMTLKEFCEHYGLDLSKVRSSKLVTHTGFPFYNIVFSEAPDVKEIDWMVFFKQFNVNKTPIEPIKSTNNVTRLIITDEHIGMTTNEEGIAMFPKVWNFKSQKQVFSKIAFDCLWGAEKGSILIIDQLGDLADGYNGETTRGGHRLPQNESNAGQVKNCAYLFDLLVSTVQSANVFSEILIHNVCNNNHSGDWDFAICEGIKRGLEAKYSNVKVYNYRKFIDHYSIGKHTFLLSHTKDKKQMRTGFKPILSKSGEKVIEDYIRDNKISGFIELSGGDTHIQNFDQTRTLFDYMKYRALSPSSEWVQTGFGLTDYGYTIQRFNKNKKDKQINIYVL